MKFMKKIDSGSGVKMEKNVSLSSVPLGFLKFRYNIKMSGWCVMMLFVLVMRKQ